MKQKKDFQKYALILPVISCLLFFLSIFSGLPFASGKQTRASLTHDEEAWLKAHPVIRLAPDPEFKPIEFFDQMGNYKGIAADYARLLEQKLGMRFEIVRCKNWEEVIKRMNGHEVDVLNAVVRTPQREAYLQFPQPYLRIPSVIIVRNSVKADLTLSMLKGMDIVMVSGYGYVDLIRNKYPELNINLVPELKTALRKVSFGMSDAFVGDLATTSYYIEEEGITNLRLAGETDPPNISGFAIRSDWPQLSSILEKGMAQISEDEKKAIYNKWIHLSAEPGVTMKEFKNVMALIATAILLIVFGFLLWNRLLKRMVNLKTEDLKKEIEGHKQTEAALAKSEAQLRTLLKTIPDLIWLKNPDGIYLACNERFERLFGAKEKDILGKTDYDFVDKVLADSFRMHDRAAVDKGEPCVNEEQVVYADDGHHEFLETIKTPVYDADGRLIGVLGISRDITERKHSEEQKNKLEDQLRQSHKMEAIGTIAGGIAHEFNNILGIIIGNTDLAMDRIENLSPARLNLEQIKKAGLRASDVVRHLLNFSRKTEQIKKTMDIRLLVKESMKLLRSSIPKSIDIQLNLPDSMPVILADPTQIHQVLINLCTNAAHSMEDEGGILKIDLTEIELDHVTSTQFQQIDPGQYIQLTISDTGHGIEPKIIANIFDPYFTTKGIGKGTGMGLAVVLGIVKNHNGAIHVYSEPGQGSTFKVLFPVADGEAIQTEAVLKKLPGGNETILFIDDEEGLAQTGCDLLEQLGYSVESKTDPQEALRLYQSDPSLFDLIITDMTMPNLQGDQLIKKVLKINPRMPVILCTGFSNKIDGETAIKIGASGYIEKPIDKKSLAYAVRAALDKSGK